MYKIESEFYSLLGSISSSLTQNEIFLKKLSKCDWNNWLMRDILHFGKYAISYSFALLLFKPSNKLLCIITTQIMVLIDLNLSNSDTTNTHIDKNHEEKKIACKVILALALSWILLRVFAIWYNEKELYYLWW